MSLDRLTKRAKYVLSDLPESPEVSVGEILDAIQNTSGLATMILQNLRDVKVNRSMLVNINSVVEEAFYEALQLGHSYVGTEHLLLALAKVAKSPKTEQIKSELFKIGTFPHSNNYANTRRTPVIDAFGVNLTEKYIRGQLGGAVYREEIEEVITVLLQKNDFSPLLVGDVGVGKASLVELLVHQIQTMDVPPVLLGYQIIEFDLVGFITSMSNREGLEFGLSSLLEELRTLDKVILYVKDVQNIFISTNVGITVPLIFSILKSDLMEADVRMILIMTSNFYDRVAGENEHIFSGFSVLNIEEPDEGKIFEILKAKSAVLSEHHNVKISNVVVKHAYEIAKKELKHSRFPKKAIDLLDQACASLIIKSSKVPEGYRSLVSKEFLLKAQLNKLLTQSKYEDALKVRTKLRRLDTRLTKEEDKIFSGKGGLSLSLSQDAVVDAAIELQEDVVAATKDDLNKLSSLASQIKKEIIGQDGAVDTVARALIRGKLGLRAKKRPLGNFLFLGPTGVGKTELAKVLAQRAFGENSLIRLDMSDFSEKHTIARLVGAPPGYVGYGEGGELTSKIEINPNSIVLFDEIEKAHPDVLNILLQIMEEGELVDARGTTFDFSHAVVVLTSNLGTRITHEKFIGFENKSMSDAAVEKHLRNNLKKILKPELINRFDEVIVFKKLKKRDQLKVLNLLLANISTSLKKQAIELKISAEVKKHLLEKGYSEEYGARALRRTIESQLLDRVAEVLLENHVRPLKLRAEVNGSEEVVVKLVKLVS